MNSDVRIFAQLKDDFPFFAERLLRIRAKSAVGGQKVIPFRLNRAQLYLHSRLEEIRNERGRVRALVLKGRQQGCSTYIGGRFYHQTIFNRGIKTFIMAHKDDATNNLFTMVKRYHDALTSGSPYAPSTSYSNRKELVFDKLDSSYALATAGGEGSGRSDTIDLFHGSESAFWTKADDIRAGAMQAAELALEVIFESTANGYDAMFYPMWQDAESGKNGYVPIFIPWYWQDEYTAPVPAGFYLSEEDAEYQRLFKLSFEQMAWRARKTSELRDPLLFKQEYPATAAEAFQVTGHESLISPEEVLRARKNVITGYRGTHVVGVDPAREGNDRIAIIHRTGRKAFGLEFLNTDDTMHIVGKIVQILNCDEPYRVDMVFIDHSGGMGAAIYDRLVEIGYGKRVTLVNFGSRRSVMRPELYVNKRAEMWGEMREWLRDDSGVDIEDLDELQADLCAPGYKYDSEQRLQLESKEDMKKRGVRSPDSADALGLTFAFPVRPSEADMGNRGGQKKRAVQRSNLYD